MTHPVKGVDHVYLLVKNLEESAERYRRLGFTLSPRGLHSKEKGTGNYTIMFPDDYFELLGIVNETDGNIHQREKLTSEGEGLHAIACRIDNAQDAKTRLTALGILTGDVGAFARPVSLPDGGEAVAAFETVSYHPSEVPQGMVFMCQHKTRETVWLPELIEHSNGANGLSAIVAVSASPEKTAEGFARLFAQGEMRQTDGEWRVSTGVNSAELIIINAQRTTEIYPGIDFSATPSNAFAALRIRVSSLEKASRTLDENGVAYLKTNSGIAVLPDNASGTILEFSER